MAEMSLIKQQQRAAKQIVALTSYQGSHKVTNLNTNSGNVNRLPTLSPVRSVRSLLMSLTTRNQRMKVLLNHHVVLIMEDATVSVKTLLNALNYPPNLFSNTIVSYVNRLLQLESNTNVMPLFDASLR